MDLLLQNPLVQAALTSLIVAIIGAVVAWIKSKLTADQQAQASLAEAAMLKAIMATEERAAVVAKTPTGLRMSSLTKREDALAAFELLVGRKLHDADRALLDAVLGATKDVGATADKFGGRK